MSVHPLYCEYDTETTGLPEDPNARVIEVGAVIIGDDGSELDTFQSLVRPDVLTEEGRWVCENICHIDPEDVLSAPYPEDVWRAFRRFLLGFSIPVWTYNLPFDQLLTRRTFLGHDQAEEDPVVWGGCTMEVFKRRFEALAGHFPDWTIKPFPLWKAMELADLAFDGDPHRALTDARAAAQIQWGLLSGVLHPPAEDPRNLRGRLVLGRVPSVAAPLPAEPFRPSSTPTSTLPSVGRIVIGANRKKE